MPMPLYLEATWWALSPASFFFSIKTSASTLRTHACANGLHHKELLLPSKAGTRSPYGLQKTQKTLALRRILASAGSSSTKDTTNHPNNEAPSSTNHPNNEAPSSTRSISKPTDNEEEIALPDHLRESLPAAKHHRPHSQNFSSVVLSPPTPAPHKRFSELPPTDQAFLLLGSITLMVCGAFVALLATAIPTLNAMKRAALSLERLADTARHELPGTMAAIRLSGMEINDLTLELSDLSQEISESVRSSARAVRAAEVGIRRMGSVAASQTLSLLQEHASAPVEAVKPVVATAAETTRHAMSQAHKAVLGLAGMPVLSKWIQRKKIEEKKKIEEDMGLESNGEFHKQGGTEVLVDP